ncbi:hypothetical protein MMC30_002723 [Trapelia coarctata]|nr:hypothetical protein [Trapelia coarctata]
MPPTIPPRPKTQRTLANKTPSAAPPSAPHPLPNLSLEANSHPTTASSSSLLNDPNQSLPLPLTIAARRNRPELSIQYPPPCRRIPPQLHPVIYPSLDTQLGDAISPPWESAAERLAFERLMELLDRVAPDFKAVREGRVTAGEAYFLIYTGALEGNRVAPWAIVVPLCVVDPDDRGAPERRVGPEDGAVPENRAAPNTMAPGVEMEVCEGAAVAPQPLADPFVVTVELAPPAESQLAARRRRGHNWRQVGTRWIGDDFMLPMTATFIAVLLTRRGVDVDMQDREWLRERDGSLG